MWPFKKKKKLALRNYAGASVGRLLDDWMTQSSSIDTEIRGSIRKLRDRARQLGRDNDYIRSILRAYENNVIGSGITLQSLIKMQRGSDLNKNLNDKIETEWYRWCCGNNCDVSGKLSFSDMERLLVRSYIESGEIFFRKIYSPFGNSKIPFALQVIEADMCDETYNTISPEGNEIRMGVELDRWQRPVAYYMFTKHPGDYGMNSGQVISSARVRVPASEIIHIFRPERPGQTRGVTSFCSSLERIHQVEGYEKAEVIAARIGACLMGFIEAPDADISPDAVHGNERVWEFAPGEWRTLLPGQKANIPQINRPGNQFDPFMRVQLRGLAAGQGVSYESTSKDYSQGSYSSARQALIEDRDNYRVIQKFVISKFHENIYPDWLDRVVGAGVIEIPNYFQARENYIEAVKWMPRGFAWIDPLKEVEGWRMAIRNGLATQSQVLAESGEDIEELVTQRKREIDLARKSGINFDTDPDFAPPATPTNQSNPNVDEPLDEKPKANGSGANSQAKMLSVLGKNLDF